MDRMAYAEEPDSTNYGTGPLNAICQLDTISVVCLRSAFLEKYRYRSHFVCFSQGEIDTDKADDDSVVTGDNDDWYTNWYSSLLQWTIFQTTPFHYMANSVSFFPGVTLPTIQGDYFDRSDPGEERTVKEWGGYSIFFYINDLCILLPLTISIGHTAGSRPLWEE